MIMAVEEKDFFLKGIEGIRRANNKRKRLDMMNPETIPMAQTIIKEALENLEGDGI